ncbi:hypothetical protein [Streptomyces murinus]|uniref:hypothetical protein n=1 Tax=Streptomyces murinus TaxID=33900 RepID=UPI003809B220
MKKAVIGMVPSDLTDPQGTPLHLAGRPHLALALELMQTRQNLGEKELGSPGLRHHRSEACELLLLKVLPPPRQRLECSFEFCLRTSARLQGPEVAFKFRERLREAQRIGGTGLRLPCTISLEPREGQFRRKSLGFRGSYPGGRPLPRLAQGVIGEPGAVGGPVTPRRGRAGRQLRGVHLLEQVRSR